MKHKMLLIMALVISSTGYSQVEPNPTMFWNNYSYFNPANTGIHLKHFLTLTHKSQLDGFEGRPKWTYLGYDYKIDSLRFFGTKLDGGIGVNYLNYNDAFSNVHTINTNLAYKRRIGVGILSWGISGRIDRIERTGLITIWSANQTDISLGLGLSYYTTKFKFGIASSPVGLISSTELQQSSSYTRERNYTLYGSYDYALNSSITFTPQALVKTDGNSTTIDANLLTTIINRYWLGATFRIQNAYGFSAGTFIKENLKVGYGIDISTTRLVGYNTPYHELNLSIAVR